MSEASFITVNGKQFDLQDVGARESIGDCSKLKTLSKDSLVSAINELYGQTEGGTSFTTDETLTLENGVLSVNTATEVEADNTLPVTSAAVNTTVGNIETILATI